MRDGDAKASSSDSGDAMTGFGAARLGFGDCGVHGISCDDVVSDDAVGVGADGADNTSVGKADSSEASLRIAAPPFRRDLNLSRSFST